MDLLMVCVVLGCSPYGDIGDLVGARNLGYLLHQVHQRAWDGQQAKFERHIILLVAYIHMYYTSNNDYNPLSFLL